MLLRMRYIVLVGGFLYCVMAMPFHSQSRGHGTAMALTISSSSRYPDRVPVQVWTARRHLPLVKISPIFPLLSSQTRFPDGIHRFDPLGILRWETAPRSLYYSSFSDRAPPCS